MGVKKNNLYQLLNGVAMTSTTTFHSDPLPVMNVDNIGIELSWTGTPTGTFSIEASNSQLAWITLTFNTALTQPAGSANSIGLDINQFPFYYIRITYTNASGTGAANAYVTVKDVN